MIIIIEGFDNSGKSTLASRLSELLNLEVVHPGGPPKHVAEVITRMAEQEAIFALGHKVDFIYDRVTCISDAAYRQDKSYDKIFGFYQASLISCSHVMVIYCRPSDAQLKNFDNHINQAHDTDEIVEHAKSKSDIIISSYDKIINRLTDEGMMVLAYNFEGDQDHKRFDQICEIIRHNMSCDHGNS